MGTVLVVLAIVSGLLLLLLALPIDVAFRFEGIDGFNGQMTIGWLFGWVSVPVRIPGEGQPPPEPASEPDAITGRSKPEKRHRRANVLAVFRQAAFRRRVYRLAKDLVRAAHLRRLRLWMRLGLGDPADTGRLWAFVGPLNLIAQNLSDADVRIEPEFIDPVLEFDVGARMRLIPLQFLALAIGFALSPVSIRAWRTLRRGNA